MPMRRLDLNRRLTGSRPQRSRLASEERIMRQWVDTERDDRVSVHHPSDDLDEIEDESEAGL
jgi:hypothetical protein